MEFTYLAGNIESTEKYIADNPNENGLVNSRQTFKDMEVKFFR